MKSYSLWVLIVLAVIAAGSSIKHLILFSQWGTLGFEAVKDITAAFGVAALYPLVTRSPDTDKAIKKAAALGLILVLAVSAIGDYALNVAHFR